MENRKCQLCGGPVPKGRRTHLWAGKKRLTCSDWCEVQLWQKIKTAELV